MAERKARRRVPPALDDYYDVVIAGAGIGGLTCGALLAKEGLKVLVVERHDRPGGYLTSYERRGYKFQVPHIMGGCGPGGDIRRVIDHLGVRLDFKKVDPFQRYIYPDNDIKVSGDVEAYAEALKEDFQPQTANINRYFKTLAGLQKAMEVRIMRRPMGMGTLLRTATYPVRFPRMLYHMYGGTTFQKLLDSHFTDDKLKTVISTPWPFLGSPPWELAALSMVVMLKSFNGGAYFPMGGYQAMADAFAEVLEEQGGSLLLGHEVTSINTEHGLVTEVEMNPRAKVKTSVVVSDVDTKRTFMRLVDRENFTRAFLDRVDDFKLSMSGFVIHLGLAKTIKDPDLACGTVFVQPSYDDREMLEEVGVTDRYPDPGKIRWSVMVHSMQDESLAPPGKSCLDILVPAVPYNFQRRWGVEEGGRRGERYRRIKEKYAEVVVEATRGLFPDLISDVEAYDVSTPVTYERYTMAIDGCWYDSAQIPGQALNKRLGPGTSVRGLYLTGSKSVLGGGIYGSLMGGALAADSVLKGKLGPALFL